jgi:hypothetical protein
MLRACGFVVLAISGQAQCAHTALQQDGTVQKGLAALAI